jgi:hypothetical protein
MMRNWKTLAMLSLLSLAALAMVQMPVSAGAAQKDAPATLDDVQKTLRALVDRVGTIENRKLSNAEHEAIAELFRSEIKRLEQGVLADLKKSVDKLNSDVGALQAEQARQKVQLEAYKVLVEELNRKLANPPAPSVDKIYMEDLRITLKSINETIARLGPTEKRISTYPPNGTPPAVGRMVLVNMYHEDLLYIVNGTPHRVAARSSRVLDGIPLGTVRYEVFSERWGVLDRQAIVLGSGETFTLTAAR